jgi:glycine oxidase
VEIYDAVVAGGGLIGASIALELAKRHLRAVIIDRQEPGKEASWAAAGMLSCAPDSTDSLPILPLSRASAEIYPSFVAEVESLCGINAGYRTPGVVEAFFGTVAERKRDARVAIIQNAGLEAVTISVEEARRLEPALSENVRAAALLPGEAVVSPRDLMTAVLTACRNSGVEILSGHTMRQVNEEKGCVAGIETDADYIFAKIVVVATGCFASLAPSLQRWAPTTPVRGQMMALRHPGQAIVRVLRSEQGYVVPRAPRMVVAGSTLEQAGFVKEVTCEGLRHILDAAIELASNLASAQVVDTWAGLRPDTPDHLPVLGATEITGLIFATGHYRNGILLAPITAQLIGELIVDGKTSLDISAFSPLRFSNAVATRESD